MEFKACRRTICKLTPCEMNNFDQGGYRNKLISEYVISSHDEMRQSAVAGSTKYRSNICIPTISWKGGYFQVWLRCKSS